MTNALDKLRHTPARAESVGQMTAVEQARAVAQVAAMVQVAQQFPRDLDRVRRDIQTVCASMALARKAFWAVPNRGQGSSVHLARAIAQVYGNFESGITELRRDDDKRESELQAFAWDLERNGRTTRTFVVPHARMKGGLRVALDDLADITNNNANVGARALREVIFNQIPLWLREEAEDLCRQTLERGDGRTVAQRADAAVAGFADRFHVTEQQLTERIGRRRSEWTPQDLASLEVVYRSIDQGETTVDEQFPPPKVTAAEVTGKRDKPRAKAQRIPVVDGPSSGDPTDAAPRDVVPVSEQQQTLADDWVEEPPADWKPQEDGQ
jgi:hypothetical protein